MRQRQCNDMKTSGCHCWTKWAAVSWPAIGCVSVRRWPRPRLRASCKTSWSTRPRSARRITVLRSRSSCKRHATTTRPRHSPLNCAVPLVTLASLRFRLTSATELFICIDASTLRWFRFDRMPSTQTINAESDACSKLLQETAALAN